MKKQSRQRQWSWIKSRKHGRLITGSITAVIYAIVANLASLALGGWIIANLPI